MASGVDQTLMTRLRELTVGALKHSEHTDLFRNTSWRLLADFVDAVGSLTIVDRSITVDDLRILVVLEGRAAVRVDGAAPVLLHAGVYLDGDPVFGAQASIESLQDSTEEAVVFWIAKGDWRKIRSLGLARSLLLSGLQKGSKILSELTAIVRAIRTEFLWVAHAEFHTDPFFTAQPLVQILAAAVSLSVPKELILTLEINADTTDPQHPRHHAELWQAGRRLRESNEEQPFVDAVFAGTLMVHTTSAGERPDRVFFHQRGQTVPVFTSSPPQGPFRAIYLHDADEPLMPDALLAFVAQLEAQTPIQPISSRPLPAPAVDRSLSGLYGSLQSMSFHGRRSRSHAPAAGEASEGSGGVRRELHESLTRLLSPAVRLLERRDCFRVVPVSESRRQRDFIRAALDVAAIVRLWREHDPSTGVFAENLLHNEHFLELGGQVARGIVFKRVGIAVSGGGASALRICPLLEMIQSGPEPVPVDVFGGVSGGALVGAYYCARGMTGIAKLIDACENLQGLLPLLPISSWPLEAWIDLDLGGRRIEDLTAPCPEFVPVTTELAGELPPRAVYVVAGTVGEGVRASGSLPVGFGPTRKNGKRYTDGAAASLLPCQVLSDKADVILGCNAVPGAAHSNPWYDREEVVLAHDYTPVGRVIDAWAWTALMLQNATRDAAYGANVYLDFTPQKYPMLETVAWERASAIIATARMDPKVAKAAHDLFVAWQNTGTGWSPPITTPSSPPATLSP